jgi:G3E family GTPase
VLHQTAEQAEPRIVRIAPGCMHCIGNLVLRITLNRLLRDRPDRLYIGAASDQHLDLLRQFLRSPPYDDLLTMDDDVVGNPASDER